MDFATFLTDAGRDARLRAASDAARNSRQKRQIIAPTVVRGSPQTGDRVEEGILELQSVIGRNGDETMLADRAEFKFIADSKFLVIPSGLKALDATAEDRHIIAVATVLRTCNLAELVRLYDLDPADLLMRFEVANTVPGDDLALHAAPPPPLAAGAAPGAWAVVPTAARSTDFTTDVSRTFVTPAGVAHTVSMADIDLLISALASRVGLNFDPRDIGTLGYTNDDRWSQAMPADAPEVKLERYTLLQIAALNLGACDNRELAAWTRAYGIAWELLPSDTSVILKEYVFSRSRAAAADVRVVAEFTKNFPLNADLPQVAANILASFGIQHLHKNHTFKAGDPAMGRTNEAYMNALRTIVDDVLLTEMKSYPEVYMRTTAHPFGLASTYFFAQWMYSKQATALALGVRHDVLPPPCQRASIVAAASDEWAALPVGKLLNQMYAAQVKMCKDFVADAQKSPPSYSELAKYYARPATLPVPVAVASAAQELMPFVYGFSRVYHVDENNRADGLALALSLMNVKRDYSAIATLLQDLWANHRDEALDIGMAEYIKKHFVTATPAPAP